MATIIKFTPNRALDLNGFSLPGALATFYDSGTSRLRTVYADPACETPHPSPLEADGAGVFPAVYDTGDGDVKVAVTTGAGVMLAGYPMDPVQVIGTDSQGASGIAFDPTEDIPETDVQAAIERVQANMLRPLAEYGLGVTGNATLLADLNAGGIASGIYRFGTETAGDVPAGVTKATGGLVWLWRESSTRCLMFLVQAGARRVWIRSRESGDWSAWVWQMTSGDTATNAQWAAGASTTPAVPSPAAIAAAIGAQALGVGQAWVVPERASGTVYRNQTGRPIMVSVQWGNGDGDRFQVSANGTTWITLAQNNSEVQAVIPDGHRYRLTSGGIVYWAELRG